jgi:hypothetical protein
MGGKTGLSGRFKHNPRRKLKQVLLLPPIFLE